MSTEAERDSADPVAVAEAYRCLRAYLDGDDSIDVGRWSIGVLVADYERRGEELSASGAEISTEWSVRAPSGNVWQLTPQVEWHARQMLRSEGGELVIRTVKRIAGPWVLAAPETATNEPEPQVSGSRPVGNEPESAVVLDAPAGWFAGGS